MIRSNSAWSLNEIETFFDSQRIPIRLACLNKKGSPMVISLWYLYQDKALWCATQQSAKIVSYLRAHPICGFEIAPESPPYRGVRGQGTVSISAEPALNLLTRLIERYPVDEDSGLANWLIERADKEVAICIKPTWMTSWDYSSRM